MILGDVKLSTLVAPHFYDIHKSIKAHDYTHHWLNGGRGSTKSSFFALEIPLLIIKNPTMHAIVLRKVAGTLKDSVFNKILWAIEALGLTKYFRCTKSPLEITYIPTGQKIYFRGADDPIKIKSITPSFGYIGIGWYEELDQFAGMEEIRNINQSIMRGGDKFYMFYSYNPPKSRDNWVNVEVMEEREDRINHKSTYLGVPKEWLGSQFIYEAEHLKVTKPQAYDHEYMGIATGTGGAVFENVKARAITDDELKMFDRLFFGLDFGFAVDPMTWVKIHYDQKHKTLYILDEIYETKLKNSTATQKIKEKHRGTMRIVADSAEPKSIAEMKSLGLNITGAQKGPDSVEHGMKWLQDLDAIVIDKNRTPNAYREFTLYEYQMDKQGNYISAYPDKNNHIIDATRYAIESQMSKTGVTI